MLPAVVLLGAAAVTGALYLFNQNWLHTIVYNDYVGMAYLVYLAAVAVALTDIVFNKARVTTRLLNLAFDAVDQPPWRRHADGRLALIDWHDPNLSDD